MFVFAFFQVVKLYKEYFSILVVAAAREDKRYRALLRLVAVIFTSGCGLRCLVTRWKMDFAWKWDERKLLNISVSEINIRVLLTTGRNEAFKGVL